MRGAFKKSPLTARIYCRYLFTLKVETAKWESTNQNPQKKLEKFFNDSAYAGIFTPKRFFSCDGSALRGIKSQTHLRNPRWPKQKTMMPSLRRCWTGYKTVSENSCFLPSLSSATTIGVRQHKKLDMLYRCNKLGTRSQSTKTEALYSFAKWRKS